MGSLVWNKVNIVLIIAVGIFIVHDIKKHGSFKASKTGKLVARLRTYAQEVHRWSQKHVPGYITRAREGLMPYLLTFKNFITTLAQQLWTNIKLVYQYFVEMKPIFVKWMNHYVPGAADQMSIWLSQACEFTLKLANLLMKYLISAMQWLKDNVFVGKLSPQNLQKYTMEAFNTTQTLAKETLSWLNSKVVTITSGA